MRVRLPAMLRDSAFGNIMWLALASGMAFGLTIPYLTLIARERGISLRVIGIMASSYLITQMFLQLPFGSLSDRFGRTPLVATGFIVEGIATAGFVIADSPATFIGFRCVQGVALALIMPALRAWIADVTPMERRGQGYAWMFAMFSGGMMLGPPLGGVLAEVLGRNPIFLIAAATNFVLAFYTFVRVREPRKKQQIGTLERVPYRALLTRPLIAAFMLGFGSRILEGMFAGIWSIYLDDLGASDLVIGLSYSTFSLTFLLCTPIGGRMADSGYRWPKMLFGYIIMAVLIAMYGLVPWVPAIMMFSLLEGAIATVPTPATDAYLSSVADPRIQGRVQGAFATIGTFGAACSALMGVWLFEIAQMLPFVTAGATLILLTVIAVPMVRRAELDGLTRRHILPPDDPALDQIG